MGRFSRLMDRLFRPRYVRLIVHVDVLREMGEIGQAAYAMSKGHRGPMMAQICIVPAPLIEKSAYDYNDITGIGA